MITFRKTLMATTMLAGFAIFALDAAQAGPNGGPSLGSISGFSSMRMDFNRVGGPGRALSRDDMRVVPIVVKKTEKAAPKDTKSAAKKGTDVARVSNPKSVTGGKGKENVSGGQNLHVPAALAEIYRITGGNLDDLAQIAALADQLKTGPLVVANPFFPAQDDGTFTPPEFPGGGRPKGDDQSDRNFLDGWAGYSSAPGGPDTSKTGWAGIWVHDDTRQGDGWSVSTYRNDETGATGTRRSNWNGDTRRREITVEGRDASGNGTRDRTVHETHTDSRGHVITSRVSESSDVIDNGDGTTTTVTFVNITVKDNGTVVYRHRHTTTETTDSDGNVIESTKEESQPAEEGYGGRPANGWCSPSGGCYRPARNNGSPRIVPREEEGSDMTTTRRASPSWATDPNPDDLGGSGGRSERTGYSPQDEEDGDIGGPGNPELSALNAPL